MGAFQNIKELLSTDGYMWDKKIQPVLSGIRAGGVKMIRYINKKNMFDEDYDAGIIEFDEEHGYTYLFDGLGIPEKIPIGYDFETAFQTYCEINW